MRCRLVLSLALASFFCTAMAAFAGSGVWTTTYPSGGNLPDLTIDPANGRLDVAPTFRGLYASTDGGGSWTSYTDGVLTLPFGPKDISAVLRSPDSNLHVLVWKDGRQSLFRSGDDGASWYVADTGISGDVTSLGFDPSNASVLYAGTQAGGFFKTTNGTVSWSAAGAGLPADAVITLEVDPLAPARIYAGTASSGLWKSVDGGASFVRIDNNVVFGEVCDVAVDPTSSLVVYAADHGTNLLYKSVDGGGSWTPLAPAFGFAGGGSTLLAIDPTNTQVLYVASFGEVWKSTDGGSTWSSASITTVQVAAVHLDPATPSTVYAATHGDGVLKSTDGGATWNEASGGLHARLFPHSGAHTLHFDATTPGLVYTGALTGGWRSLDNGATWSRMNAPWPQFMMATRASEPGVVWAKNNDVWKSADSGVTWADASGGYLCCFNDGDMVLHPSDPQTVYVAAVGSGSIADGVYKTTDGGATWNLAVNGLGNTLIHALAIDPADGDVLYAGVPDYAGPGNGIYKTTDGGANWFQLGGGLPSPLNPNQILVHPADSNLVYAGTATQNGGVYRSTDGGATWSLLLSENVNAVAVDPGDVNRVYAGTWYSGGFYRSLDGGATWTVINAGLPQNPGIHSIALDSAGSDRVLIGTDAGAWEYTFQGTVTLEVASFGDAGPGTLRDAMTQANQDGVPNVITFASWMAGGTIAPQSDLPALTENGTTIDGDLDDDCVPDIEIAGWGGAPGDGLTIFSSDNVIEGLVIDLFPGGGIVIAAGDNNVVVCNYIGTDRTGTSGRGNGDAAIHVRGNFNQIGTSAQPNVLLDNGMGINVNGVTGNVIEGNRIGLGLGGESFGNGGPGVLVWGLDAEASEQRIGPDNIISENGGAGIEIQDGTAAGYPDFTALVPDATGQFPVMEWNSDGACQPFTSGDGQTPLDGAGSPFLSNFGARFTGTLNVDGAGEYSFDLPSANGDVRIVVDAAVVVDVSGCCGPFGGSATLATGDHTIEVDYLHEGWLVLEINGPGTATLTSGGQPGLFGELFHLRTATERNTITQNSIFNNGGPGIQLGRCFLPGNDPGDVDVGPNTRLNSPELTGVTDDGGGLFTVSGTAETDATVELFAVAPDVSGYGEGETFLAAGVATGGVFSIQVNRPADRYAVTATATDTTGNTSEFSANLELLPHPITVTNTSDSGPGSLRDAIDQANNDSVSTHVTIDPGLSGQTIFVLSPLPALTEDGTTLDADLGGDCVPDLELDGSVSGGDGFMIQSSNNTVRGFVINNYLYDDGIHIDQGSGNVVVCNYIGTEPDGVTAAPNGNAGVYIFSSNNFVGPGNVIAYNNNSGITVEDRSPWDAFPGFAGFVPDYTGVFPVMEFQDNCSSFESVDGITPLDGGGVPFTEHFGARFTGTLDVDVPGNYYFELQNLDDRGRITVDGDLVVDSDSQGCCNPAGNYDLSGSHSIEVDFEEGGGAAGFRLYIDGPGTATLSTGGQPGLLGELFQLRIPAEGNSITQNSIFENDGLGIAFNCCCGPSPNDPGDADVGPNTLLNSPELHSFTDLGGGSFTVDGTAPPDSTVEVFGAALDPSGFGEGKEFLGATAADPGGNFSITASLPGEFDSFTATATDAGGNTSEFSQNLSVKSPDEVYVGFAEGFQGDTIEIPVYVRDLGSTLLGADQPAGNKIQGFTVQVEFRPSYAVQAANAYHSGITAGLSVLFDTFVFTGNTLTYVASFDEGTNLVPLTLDAAAPGDEVARLVVTIDPGAPPSPVQVTLLGGTTLSNQAGTLTETEGNQLAFVHGSFNVRTRAATSLFATALSSSDVRLRWNDPQADETGFRVDRSDDGGGSWWTIATLGPDDTEYYDSGLSAGTVFYYRVTATNGGVDAPTSNQAWAETFPASATKVCIQQVSPDHSWMRFPSPAYNGSMWANSFYERWYSTNDEVYFQFHDAWGNPASGWVSLSETDMMSRFPTMRWNGSHFGVMWTEHMRDGEGHITSNNFFGLLDANGQVVRKKVRLFEQVPLGGLNNDLKWAFDWDGGGWGHVATDLFSPPSSNLVFYRFREDGEVLTGPVQISFTNGIEGDVSLVWNGSEYGVAWLHHDGSTHEVLFRRFLPDGSSPDPGPVTVHQAGPGEYLYYTSLVWNGTGWAVAWDLEDSAGDLLIHLRLLAGDGTPLASAERLSDDEDPTWPGSGLEPYDDFPELVHLPGGGYVVYTSSYSYATGAYEIARLEADAAGVRVGARTFMTDEDGANSVYQKIATDGTDYLVLYNEHRQGGQETGGFLAAADGTILSGPNDHSCCHSPGNAFGVANSSAPAAVEPVLDGFLTVWLDIQAGPWQMYAQYFDGAGNPSSSWWPLSGRDVLGLPGVEALGGDFAVAWKDGGNTIVFDRFYVFGGSYGEVELAYDTGGRGDVDLAWSGEAYGVAYMNGNDVVLQRVDGGGGLVGGPVTVAAGNGRRSVHVQWTGAGWAVMWWGLDSYLHYALVDAYGSVVAGPHPVTSGPVDNRNFHFLWTGESFGLTWLQGNEIYFNLLDLSGNPTLGDVLVLSPVYWPGAPYLYWTGDRFRLVRGGGSGGSFDEDGMHEDEIFPDGTVITDVGQLTNRGNPGAIGWNGATLGLAWGQLHETYFETRECLTDATPPACPNLGISKSDTAVELNWNGVGDPESTTWRYDLYRDGTMLAELFPWTESYSDAGYRSDFVHTYEVRALNGAYRESQGCPVETFSTLVADGNGDGVTDVADVIYLIQYLFAGGPAPLGDADGNGDGAVNVADVFYLINYLFGGGPPPVPLEPGAAGADVLAIGHAEAPAGSIVQVPVYLRDLPRTPLGGDGAAIQGFAFRVDYPAKVIAAASFVQAGVTAGRTPIFPIVRSESGHLVVLLKFLRESQPLSIRLDAPAPGDLVGYLRLRLAAGLSSGSRVDLVLDGASALVNDQATMAESSPRGTLALVDGAVVIGGDPSIFRDGFESGSTSAWSLTIGGI